MNKLGKRVAGIMLAAGVAVSLFVATPVTSMAYTTSGKVVSDNVKVRESASTTAKQVSSLKNGDVVDIVDEATDASGYVWYKIFVNKSEYGYVRSDLVSKSGGSSSSSNTTTTSTSTSTTTSTASLPETQVTATEQKSATVTSESVNVRKGAGTAYDSVGKVTKGQTVTITGEASGTDGKTWYQITFGDGKTGFVRNDLVAISEGAPAENTETTENTEGGDNAGAENAETPAEGEATQEQSESQPATTTSQTQGDGKYSLVYSTEEDGSGIWYLYAYDEGGQGGYRVKVDDLIAAAQSADAVNNLRKQSDNYKKIAIFLGGLAAILVAVIVFLIIRLRDSVYYEDEEEEEEYDRYSTNRKRTSRNEEERPLRRADRGSDEDRRPRGRNEEPERASRRPEREAEERTVRPTRRPQGEADERPARRPERNAERDYDRPSKRVADDRNAERPSRRPAQEDDRPVRRSTEERRAAETREEAPKRRARNFVGDDDDFEFEFLDLDD